MTSSAQTAHVAPARAAPSAPVPPAPVASQAIVPTRPTPASVGRHEMPSPMSDAPLREWQCSHAESMKILEKVTSELRDPVHAVSRARVGLGREAQPMRVFRTAHSRQMAGVAES
jgi:hypothetical protein